MIDLSIEAITAIFIAAILVGVLLGYYVAIMVGAVGFVIGLLVLGPVTSEIMYYRIYGLLLSYPILALPLFVFMGAVLSRSGVTDRLFDALYLWLGKLRGGLAISTVLFGTVLAACLGVITASVSMLTVIALNPMLKRGYDKAFASGAVCAAGTLGILIPPSIMLVIYGPAADISVGKLFMGAIIPGLVLSGLYCVYIATRAFITPEIAPGAPIGESKTPLGVKIKLLLTSLVPAVVLILSVLGAIFFGIAPPTEAAGAGALASVLLAIAYRKFNLNILKESALETLRITSFVMFIGCLAYAAVGIFLRIGCGNVVKNVILAAPFGPWGVFMTVQIVVFILGMFLDWIGIVFIIVPIVSPIVPILGFDPVWFALMVCINLQMAFLSPPFAPAIFVCRGTASPELGLTTADTIRGVIPFIILIIVGLGLFVAFPELILWLPGKMIK